MTLESLIPSFIIGLVGFCLFRYGKKQLRFPQLIAGFALMLEPWVLPDVLPMTIGAAVLLIALWTTLRLGW